MKRRAIAIGAMASAIVATAVAVAAPWPGSSAQRAPAGLALGTLPVPVASGFRMEGYWIWCGSVIKVGREYHLFAARWPKDAKYKFPEGYRQHSEIVRAVSKSPVGPYQFKEVVIGERDRSFWDANMAHNPTIHRIGTTYVLFYIGSDFETRQPNSNALLRRVGYATAASISGPWTRAARPVIEAESNNPAVLVGKKGVSLVYRDAELRTYLATAAAFGGPYRVINDNVWPGSRIEDFYLFWTRGRAFMLCEDNAGGITGHVRWGALLTSDNGVDGWRAFGTGVAYDHDIVLSDGRVLHAERRERPQLLIEDGRITHLVTGVYDGNDSWSQPVPLAPGWPFPGSGAQR